MPEVPDPDVRVLAGPRAARLTPRARALNAAPNAVELEFDWTALESEDLDALQAAALGPAGGDPPSRRSRSFDLNALTRLGAASADIAVLLHAALAVIRPPRPPRLVGVLNVTPDSFSDGGRHLEPASAVARARAMLDEGASMIDVGGESTRPGAKPVPLAEELARVLPVIQELRSFTDAAISIDTTRAQVAAAALDAGAVMVNDVSAGRLDPDMLPLVKERGAQLVLMHMLGTPRYMQKAPCYAEVVADVVEALRSRVGACIDAGIDPARLWIDPGIGFGKTLEHNLALLGRVGELRSLGLPVYVGVSRKSFIGAINAAAGRGGEAPDARLGGTAAAVAACVAGGVELLRVHDVGVMTEAARVARALFVGHAE